MNHNHNDDPNNTKIVIEFGENNPNIHNNKQFPNNKIETTKYNCITWAPKSLIMQFKRAANIYFLVVSILTFMDFSPKQPASMIGTFAFVLICTMIKELIEDWGRYKQDRQANNRLVWKLHYGEWKHVRCWTLMPGDVVKVEKDEEFSADILILKSTNENGYCYIDTKNLDGETNLKEKASLEEFKNIDDLEVGNVSGNVECEPPNENLSTWKGRVTLHSEMTGGPGNTTPIYCKLSNIILKGCLLKNTQHIVGIVVYSGKNTKIMKNSKAARIKTSNVLLTMNKLLYTVFFFDIALCITFGTLNLFWVTKNKDTYTYIFPKNYSILGWIQYFFTFFVAYSHMIPISLYVALELVKISQGFLIHYDNDIFDKMIDKPANCRATDLIEELGQVEFIFSDKTGTLTQNVMVLKKVYIYGKVYGSIQLEAPDAPFTINGDTHLVNKLKSTEPEDAEEKAAIEDFFYLLSLCHAVFPEEGKDNKIVYQGASPDDIALVQGAQQLGVEFLRKQFDDMIIKNNIFDTSEVFEFKIDMPFDSDRKRMSVVLRDKNTNQYILYSKGADTMMLPRMNLDETEKAEVARVIKVLSKEGLRVLMMGKRVLKEEDYLDWDRRFKHARDNGKEESLNAFYEELENSLTFVGCSAIEDKLQEGVSETIYTLLTCNIRVWVLTGDKQDTAEEIAKSCKLINENMFTMHLVEDGRDTREKILHYKTEFDIKTGDDMNEKIDADEISRKIRKQKGKDLSIIIDGYTLEIILADQELSMYFFYIAIAAKSVVCCRVTPKQKSKVVQLAKTYGKWVTLSIGDGANDVPMIMEAHIGVGIQGKEGTQAVRSADFSIGQFRFLEKLLLIYGRVGYVKISKFICYYFYKNIILVFTDILFNFQNGFSGQIFFADYLSTLYNAFFTSWPCLFTFSLERDVDLNIVKRFPILYVAGQKNYYFNLKVFWSYILYAIFHGFVCYFLSEEGMINANDSSGVTFNHWYKSTVSFSLVIHIVTYKLLIISDFWNGLSLFATIFSICFYYIVILVLCSKSMAVIFQNELAGLIFNIASYPKFWMVIVVGPILALVPDFTFKQIFYSSYPNPTYYINQHLQDPEFRALVFNEDTNSAKFNSPEAKKAEKVLKDILKKARDHKMKRRTDVMDSSETPLRDARDNYLTLNDNKKVNITSGNTPGNLMLTGSSGGRKEVVSSRGSRTGDSNKHSISITNENNSVFVEKKNDTASGFKVIGLPPKKPTFTRDEMQSSFSEKDSHASSIVSSGRVNVTSKGKTEEKENYDHTMINNFNKQILASYLESHTQNPEEIIDNSISSADDESDDHAEYGYNKKKTLKKMLDEFTKSQSETVRKEGDNNTVRSKHGTMNSVGCSIEKKNTNSKQG